MAAAAADDYDDDIGQRETKGSETMLFFSWLLRFVDQLVGQQETREAWTEVSGCPKMGQQLCNADESAQPASSSLWGLFLAPISQVEPAAAAGRRADGRRHFWQNETTAEVCAPFWGHREWCRQQRWLAREQINKIQLHALEAMEQIRWAPSICCGVRPIGSQRQPNQLLSVAQRQRRSRLRSLAMADRPLRSIPPGQWICRRPAAEIHYHSRFLRRRRPNSARLEFCPKPARRTRTYLVGSGSKQMIARRMQMEITKYWLCVQLNVFKFNAVRSVVEQNLFCWIVWWEVGGLLVELFL
jgi:hypothetical protein